MSRLTGQRDWVVTNANHWVYAGTGLSNGSRIPDLIYYRMGRSREQRCDSGRNHRARLLRRSEQCPAKGAGTKPRSMNEAPAVVFAAGTIFFNQHLRTSTRRSAQMLKNVLTRAGASAYVP